MQSLRIEYRQSDLPKRLLRIARKLPTVVDNAVRSVAHEAREDFEATVDTWTKPPKFKVLKDTKGWKITVDDKRFLWVDKGTSEHLIVARKKKRLSWYGGGTGSYVPKTQPNVIGSQYSYIDGAVKRVSKYYVRHPGTEPRNFSRAIEKRHSFRGNKVVAKSVETFINREAPGI